MAVRWATFFSLFILFSAYPATENVNIQLRAEQQVILSDPSLSAFFPVS